MKLNDVTLREGDQMPGRSYDRAQKIECAKRLDELGLDFIQPGFPATGEKDREVIAELADTVSADVIGLARAVSADIDAAIEANADVVEVFVPTSDRQLEHLLGKSRDEMLSILADAVDQVRDRGGTPHVTLADAFRTSPSALVEVFETVADVPFVNLADSVGVRTPRTVRTHLEALDPHVDLSRVGVHFHDDLGCGTANALAAYMAGVGKADVSVASLGERAGNTALEELVVACTLDHDDALGVNESALVPCCRDVLRTLDEDWDDRKAVLGETAFEHESGIHTAAMLEDPATLEPYDPTRFGGARRLTFGRQTGRSAAERLLDRAGIDPDQQRIERYLDALAERGPLGLDGAIELAEREFGA